MKLLNLAFFILILTSSFAQNKIYFDSDWHECKKRNAKYFRTLELVNDTVINVRDYFITGQLQMKGTFRDVKNETKNGYFEWYYRTGAIESKANYINNKVIGVKKTWNLTQDTLDIIPFSNGLIHGTWVTKNANNDTIQTIEFLNDKMNGEHFEYHTNGKLKSYGIHENDVREGKWTIWKENGNKDIEINYSKGQFNGFLSSFNYSGNLEAQYYYEMDSMLFQTFLTNELGEVIFEYKPSENPTTGMMYYYYPDNKVQVKFEIINLISNGKYTSYYENGVVESQGETEDGFTIGRWHIFDQNGNLMEKIFFDNSNRIRIE